MGSLRGPRRRRRVRIGAPDPTLTPVSGMVAVTELVERLAVVGRLDAAIGPIKQRRRGHTAGQMLVGFAAAQTAGEDFLVGLDRQRADTAGQQLAPVPDWAASTAAGLARPPSPQSVEAAAGAQLVGEVVAVAADAEVDTRYHTASVAVDVARLSRLVRTWASAMTQPVARAWHNR